MWGCGLKVSLAALPARSTMRANPAVVNGAPRSDVNTKGDLGSCSRWSSLRARNSSPRIGCVLGVPCLTLRTCRVAVVKSTCSQRRSVNSEARRPLVRPVQAYAIFERPDLRSPPPGWSCCAGHKLHLLDARGLTRPTFTTTTRLATPSPPSDRACRTPP
jgi:hypothetical protein